MIFVTVKLFIFIIILLCLKPTENTLHLEWSFHSTWGNFSDGKFLEVTLHQKGEGPPESQRGFVPLDALKLFWDTALPTSSVSFNWWRTKFPIKVQWNGTTVWTAACHAGILVLAQLPCCWGVHHCSWESPLNHGPRIWVPTTSMEI